MEDPIAREGTLARCNQDRDANADDPECINARRAASTAAARAEAARAEQHEAASDMKREALRERIAVQQAAAQRAEAAAQQAEEAAYDAQWSEGGQQDPDGTSAVAVAPAYGQGITPSVTESVSREPPVNPADQLTYIEVPEIESPVTKALAEVELPAIAKPIREEPKLEELTIPRPFRYPETE